MGKRILDNIELIRGSHPFIDCLYGVLTSANLFDKPKYMLSGMTGLSFKFIAHKRLLVSSTLMYDRALEHSDAIDILGIYSESWAGRINNPTFQLHQKYLIKRIRESIDNGYGVVGWITIGQRKDVDFGIIYGYDDYDRVLYYKTRGKNEQLVMLYENVGIVNAASWCYHFIGEKVEKDIIDIYRKSLETAIDEWEIPYKLPHQTNSEFASGRKAYEHMTEALEKGDYDEYGANSIINYYINYKLEIYEYLKEVIKEFPELDRALERYGELNGICHSMEDLIDRRWGRNKLDRSNAPVLVKCFKEAQVIEERAVNELKKYFKELLDNRYIDYYDIKKF
jgi:hypothetical protein